MRMSKIRHSFLALMALALPALLVIACGNQPQGETEAAGVVAGEVIYLDRAALDPNAVIEVELVQIAADSAGTVVASETVNAEGRQVPIPFELNYDPAQIDPTQTYMVQARILVNGQPVYASQAGVPVITNGAPSAGIEVLVGPVMTGAAGGMLTGTVTYLERVALAPDAVISVDLQDVSAGVTSVIARVDVPVQGRQVPIPFELPYDPALINPAGTYLAGARIVQGEQIAFASSTGVPVLTNGAPTSNIEIVVSPAVAAAPGATAPGAGAAIRGQVTTPRPPESLSPTAVMQVELREPLLADAPAAAIVEIPMAGASFPFSFELPYDPATIVPDRTYAVGARVLDGNRLLYTSLAPVPVLTGGAPASEINVPVAFAPDPAGGVLRFTVTGDAPASWAFGSDAVLNVEIREPLLADAPATAFGYIPLAGLSLPVAYELGYDPATIDPNRDYIFDARIIESNQLTYSSNGTGAPVLTKGAPLTDVTLALAHQVITDAPPSGVITGVVTTDAPAPLDPAANLFIDFRVAGTTGDPIVTISQQLAGAQFPIPFEVPYDAASIDPNQDYVLGARILLGDQVLYASAVGTPVLTKGAPATGVTVNFPPQ